MAIAMSVLQEQMGSLELDTHSAITRELPDSKRLLERHRKADTRFLNKRLLSDNAPYREL